MRNLVTLSRKIQMFLKKDNAVEKANLKFLIRKPKLEELELENLLSARQEAVAVKVALWRQILQIEVAKRSFHGKISVLEMNL